MNTQQIILKDNWRFHLGDIPEAWTKGYQDMAWTCVTLPHDWSVTMPFSKEYSSGTGYLAGGIGWYRGSFFLDEKYRGQKVSIVFDGVYKNSQVWCNSYYKGNWPNGYTTFRYDITDQVNFGAERNVISVKVSHCDLSDSRWFTGSGITRKVYLVIEDAVHPVADGIFFTTDHVSEQTAEVTILNEFINDYGTNKNVVIKNILVSPEGEEVVALHSTVEMERKATTTVCNKGILTNPCLWSPDTPFLYTLNTYLQYVDTPSSDEITWHLLHTQKVGIRNFRFDSDTGFYINEVSTKLKGICMHHDAGCLGAAVLPEVWARRLEKLKEMGCNAIRMSHNPNMPELYDLCDTLGFFVMDEAFDEWEGVKNKWTVGHNVYPPKHQGYFEHFPEWHEKDLKALVRRDRNHPSIIMWSIGNEIDYPNDPYCHPLFQSMTGNNDANKPESERMYSANRPNTERLTVVAEELAKIIKNEDTTRPVTLSLAFPELSSRIGIYDHLDILSYNYKEHLYEEDHKRFPNKPLLGGENHIHYHDWLSVTQNDYIAGQFLWTGIDFLGEAKGWPIHGSKSGLMTLAGFEKFTYYERQSYWSTKPNIHLVTARADEVESEWTMMYESWNYVPGELIEVHCYTNQAQAELFCNEKSFGCKEYNKEVGYISWQIPYQSGFIKAVSVTEDSGNNIEHVVETFSGACQLQLSRWEPTHSGYIDVESLNHDVLQIEVTVADQADHRVVNDSSLLSIDVNQNAILLGIENGDVADFTEYSATYRRAFEGRLLLYIRKTNPSLPAIINVTGENLKKGSIII